VRRVNVFIATPLEPERIERIRAAVPAAEILWEPALLPAVRYPSDHRGVDGFARDAAQRERWNALLSRAEVVLGIPGETPLGIRETLANAPHLRWLQCMYAGAGEQLRAAELTAADLERVRFTSAAGVHAIPLAEFVFLGLLALKKEFRRIEGLRARRAWDTLVLGELHGARLTILGMGAIGREIARTARGFGLHVTGLTRDGRTLAEADESLAVSDLTAVAGRSDILAITLPGTPQTRGLVSREVLAALPRGAIVANVGRGTIVDQPALIEALRCGALGGAVLDVFDPEPLPTDSALWTLENAIVAPHTAARSFLENERIVELFCDNLLRYAAGQPLRNPIDTQEFY
jgi:phosphoglycerate dehydrogenase-like enzyme